MGRAKVAMEPIADKKKRSLTFQNRKECIFKKARQLTTLCDVDVSMIICTKDDHEPQIFPPDPAQFNAMIKRYRTYKRTMEPGSIRSYGLSDFFKGRQMKIEEELAKAKKKNMEAKYPTWFDFLNDFSEEKLRGFASGLETKINQVKSKIQTLKNNPKADQNTPW